MLLSTRRKYLLSHRMGITGAENVSSVPTFADCKPLIISQSDRAQP